MSMDRVSVSAALFDWACQRADLVGEDLYKRFPQYDLWISGEKLPTLKQLERNQRPALTIHVAAHGHENGLAIRKK